MKSPSLFSALSLALVLALGLSACSSLSGPAGPAGGNAQAPSFIFTPPASHFQAVAAGNGMIVAAGSNIQNSVDGLSWTTDTSSINSDFAAFAAIYANGAFYVVDRTGRVHKRDSANPGAGTWTVVGLSAVSNATGIASGPSGYVVVGSSGTVAYSPDAAAWTGSTGLPASAFRQLHAIAYGPAGFVAVGSNDSNNVFSDIVVSGDGGVTWTEASSYPSAGTLRGVTYGNGRYVAVGDADTLLVSSDAQKWTAAPTPVITSALYGATFANGLFAVSGTNGSLLTSPNGLSWSDESWANLSSATLSFYAVAGFGSLGDVFVIADY